jgi:aryl-alcohol dehydrogenase-like predicted oxidoreductase
MRSHERSGTFELGDLRVRRLGYGDMHLSGPGIFGPPQDRDAALAVLREAVAPGVNHIDTSDYYGSAHYEPTQRDLALITLVRHVPHPDRDAPSNGPVNPATTPASRDFVHATSRCKGSESRRAARSVTRRALRHRDGSSDSADAQFRTSVHRASRSDESALSRSLPTGVALARLMTPIARARRRLR